jgi:hypothetical protein
MRYFFSMPFKALDHLQDELLRAGAAFLPIDAFLALAGLAAAGAAFLNKAWICILD